MRTPHLGELQKAADDAHGITAEEGCKHASFHTLVLVNRSSPRRTASPPLMHRLVFVAVDHLQRFRKRWLKHRVRGYKYLRAYRLVAW